MAEAAAIDAKFYLVGGGIASLAAAAFLIRDADIPGSRITILEASQSVGGSLDAVGSPESGYVMRGGRMFESKYLCTFDLFSSIPALDGTRSVTQQIVDWNRLRKTESKSRLFRGGRREDAPDFGMTEHHLLELEWLLLKPELALGRTAIADHFGEGFFSTNFWLMWSTTFAFQRWHSAVEFKRYLLRFLHMVTGFNRLEGILRTPYNQYDSLIRPLQSWLREAGVHFALNSRVTDLGFLHDAEGYAVERIALEREDWRGDLRVRPQDYVFVTLGSMTEGSRLGSMTKAAELSGNAENGSWALWRRLASTCRHFGRPEVFDGHISQSKWVSFTVTMRNPTLFTRIRDLTGNVPGEGGLVTFPDANWLLSMVVPHQPHFLGQPQDVQVFWGYGLLVDSPGNFVSASMSSANGRELMLELFGHLGLSGEADDLLAGCTCIPCMMPYITSQFLCRGKGDRPEVVPDGSKNLAFLGQYCELPEDVVFTVEYSVRSAQTAVYRLLNLDPQAPAVYRGRLDPQVVLSALIAVHA